MTFRKFRKKYRILKISICSINETAITEIYSKGRAVGICVDLKNKEEFEFELFCKINDNEIAGKWKRGHEGQVKVYN